MKTLFKVRFHYKIYKYMYMNMYMTMNNNLWPLCYYLHHHFIFLILFVISSLLTTFWNENNVNKTHSLTHSLTLPADVTSSGSYIMLANKSSFSYKGNYNKLLDDLLPTCQEFIIECQLSRGQIISGEKISACPGRMCHSPGQLKR